MDLINTQLTAPEIEKLSQAVTLLNAPTLTDKMVKYVGKPIESLFKYLPANAEKKIGSAVRLALDKASDVASWKMSNTVQEASPKTHKLFAGISGAVGGFFGISAILAELPVSTVIMMRAIMDIARSEGFDINSEEVQLECLKVFALENDNSKLTKGNSENEAETGYFAVRAALAESLNNQGTKVASKLIETVAARFSVTVTDKVAAQLVPVIGAVSGASINLMFTDYYQDMARGHFIIKRLTDQYGETAVKATYTELKLRMFPQTITTAVEIQSST